MSMISFFPKKLAVTQGKPNEYVAISRTSKGESINSINTKFNFLMEPNTTRVYGDILAIDGQSYFIVTLTKSIVNTVAQTKRANSTIDIIRIKKHYTGSSYDYDEGLLLYEQIVAYYEDVTGKQQQYDLGLKSTSTRRFLTPILDYKLLDIIRFNGEFMQVDDINTSSYPNLYWVQCSPYREEIKVIE